MKRGTMMSRNNESPGLWVNWLAMFFCLALTSTQLQGQNKTETVATTGDAAPDGNGEFGFLSSIQLNNTGQASFTSSGMTGTDLGSTDSVGVFRAGVGGLVQIARSNTNVLSVGGSRINDSGQVAYGLVVPGGAILDPRNGIQISDGTVTTTVALEPAGAGNEVSGIAGFNNAGQIAYRLQLGFTDSIRRFNGANTTQIVQEGQAAPDGDGVLGNLALDSRRQAINESGQVAFYADIAGASSTSTNQGIFRSDGVNLTQIARKGQISPDGNGQFSDLREFDSPQPSINDHGQVAFVATLNGTSGGPVDSRGLYIGDGGTLSQILRSGQTSPDGNGSFLNFVDAHLNNSGQVAFLGVMAENDGGIFQGSAGGITKIARTGDAAYDGNGFFSANYAGLAQNDSGQTAFIASTASSVGGLPDGEGLFTSDGIDSLTVVRFGDSLEGSTVAGIGDNPRRQIALNRHGQIAYRAQLADGRDTLQLWTPDLHWRTSGNGEWDTGNNWTLGLNPAEVHDVFIDPSSSAVVVGPTGDANVRNLSIGGGGGLATLVMNGSELAVSAGFGNRVTVHSDGVLAGSGQINGNTEVFGSLAPGESAGHLSFQGDLLLNSLSSLSIDLGGLGPSQFDQITVFDDLFLEGLLNVNLIGGHSLGANESYLIADIGGTLTGQFSGLGEGGLVGNFGGVDLFISYTRGNGNDIALFTTVPEPCSFAFLFSATLVMLTRRRA